MNRTLNKIVINDVSDTAIWVAYYRAKESLRADAMFRDPLAQQLIGERGAMLAEHLKKIGYMAEWTVLSRTVIIDDYITNEVANGVDAVINLGAGLDTRPYRIKLPSDLLWIEADFAKMIEFKTSYLQNEKPSCQVLRVSVDLANDKERQHFLKEAAPKAKKVLILTEGVIAYLSIEQVGKLADELHSQTRFVMWSAEYISTMAYPYLQKGDRSRKLKNAPFRFFPTDWMQFFRDHGWGVKDIHYASEIAERFHRNLPMPWWGRVFLFFANTKTQEQAKKLSGFTLFERL